MEVCGESEKSSENVCEGYDVSRFVMSLARGPLHARVNGS